MTDLCHKTDSRRRSRRAAVLACAGALALALGACGDSDNGGGDDASTPPGGSQTSGDGFNAGLPSDEQKKGGTLKLLFAESSSHQDPGQAYFQLDYMMVYAAHRALYYFKPDDLETPAPDIADGQPEVSSDNRTVTVKLKRGIKYGTVKDTPINGQEVKAADIKYAFERALNPTVANGYFATYFSTISGSKNARGGNISGITTPDDYTVRFKLDKPFGATVAKALVMPIAIPVPKSHASRFDRRQPNPYDTDPEQQAFTGPYMVSDFQSGKSVSFVRNPNWDANTDERPAYLDRIEWTLNVDPNVAGRQIFSGSGLANGDTPTPSAVRRFVTRAKDRISFTPLGNRWVSLNTQKKPFSDLNVRKAAAAALDRKAMQLTRGGAVAGDIATHFLPPGIPGHEEAGGAVGAGVDYLAKPEGDPALAAEYMRKAGFESGKYDGPPIRMFSANDSPAKEGALVVRRALESLGFDVRDRSLDQSVLYSKFCNVKSELEKMDVCANYGWLPDFIDPYAMLNANFNGEAIVEVNNSNPSLFDNEEINRRMNEAATIADPQERAKVWGEIDKDLVRNVAAIPWFWDKTPNILSKDVHGVIAQWNAAWDLSYMSLK